MATDAVPVDKDNDVLPRAELTGDVGASMRLLAPLLNISIDPAHTAMARRTAEQLQGTIAEGRSLGGFPIHTLRLVSELQRLMTRDTHVARDVGSNYIWSNRYCVADDARQVMVSNSQQTPGVSIAAAIALSLLCPNDRVFSTSGDGGVLFTAIELEIAVRVGARFLHVIWGSQSYDMVSFQEQAHYGETAGVKLCTYDVVKFAEAFGCKGYSVCTADELGAILDEAFTSPVSVLVHVPVDYSHNARLMQDVIQSFVN